MSKVHSPHVHSYPKIWNMGHPAITLLLLDDVIVEEKVDGSQFSFGIYNGEVACRSKGKQLILDNPEKMFTEAVATVRALAPLLRDGWTYRAEYLQTKRHNVLDYDRIPSMHLVVFDIHPGDHQHWLTHEEKAAECARIGLECVPLLHVGRIETLAELHDLTKRTSYLGGPQIEGFVIKNYSRFGKDGHPLFGKHVREDFKEQLDKSWKERHPSMSDIKADLGARLQTAARWQKAVQRMRERGELTNSPKDIGPLVREVQADLEAEAKAFVAEELMNWAWKDIVRIASRGIPEWWKGRLLERQVAGESE